MSFLNYWLTRVFKQVELHVYGVMDTNNCISYFSDSVNIIIVCFWLR